MSSNNTAAKVDSNSTANTTGNSSNIEVGSYIVGALFTDRNRIIADLKENVTITLQILTTEVSMLRIHREYIILMKFSLHTGLQY